MLSEIDLLLVLNEVTGLDNVNVKHTGPETKSEIKSETETGSLGRFKPKREEEVKNLEDKNHKDWHLYVHGDVIDWVTADEGHLNKLFRKFYCEVASLEKKSKSAEQQPKIYHKNTMKIIRATLNRHLSDIAETSPTTPRPAVWYNLAIHFVSRGLEFHHQLKRDSFESQFDEYCLEYARLTHETQQKNFQGGITKDKEPSDRRMYATGSEACRILAEAHHSFYETLAIDTTVKLSQNKDNFFNEVPHALQSICESRHTLAFVTRVSPQRRVGFRGVDLVLAIREMEET
ncbi:hypothetical protein MAR_003892 [Mya arenaria]|uniref:Uncharacterized protein n=1 Tax=Mya arenaria TaxID=6604 RepID=A0ABY7EX02_MYAAR|nr:hypothetical protein MAR_003892 [Mya arenaria]